jgi:DNA (cytosine-5)-methyltransferase 1
MATKQKKTEKKASNRRNVKSKRAKVAQEKLKQVPAKPLKRVRPPAIRAFLDDDNDSLNDDEIVVDNFAGGGGASSGVERAIGRSPDIAINHDEEAIQMHMANHPDTTHYRENIWQVDPVAACQGRRVGLVWCSPDCKHFSKAKGTTPRDQKIRGLAWTAVRWAQKVRPRVIALENVEEFATWGPLHRRHAGGCKPREVTKTNKKTHQTTTTVECSSEACNYGLPIKERKGETFKAFVSKLERLGYKVEWKLLRACDYGAPTSRRRFFMIARCDGRAITWPAATHGAEGSGLLPYRTAAECIDWSVMAPSIFERDKQHAEKTLARIARGIRKFVLASAKPFIVTLRGTGDAHIDSSSSSIDQPLRTVSAGGTHHAVVTPYLVPTAHGDKGGAPRVHSADEPLRTICGNRGDEALVVPYLVHRSNGERPIKVDDDGTVHAAQAPRIYDIKQPLGTVMAQGQKHALVSAMLIKHNGGHNDEAGSSGQSLDKPCDSITSRDSKSLATVTLAKLGNDELMKRARKVAAFLVRYNGKGEPESLEKPLGTLTTRDRYGLVTVEIDGETYAIVDIGMRMLTPGELFAAQGFPPDYDITAEKVRGEPLTKTAQVKMCGNSVPPPMSEAIVRAQFKPASTEKSTPAARLARHAQVPLPGFTTVVPPKPYHVMQAVRA